MAAIGELSIELVYTDETVGSWTLGALARNAGVIHPDHLAPEAFYDVFGGLRVATDRIFRFLDVDAAFDLVAYVRFLIGGVVEVQGQPVPAALEDFRSASAYEPIIASVLHQDGSRVQLRLVPEGLALDHLDPEGEAPDGRGSPYFDGLLLDPVAWRAAALEALAEYRAVLGDLLAGAPIASTGPVTDLVAALDALRHFSEPHS